MHLWIKFARIASWAEWRRQTFRSGGHWGAKLSAGGAHQNEAQSIAGDVVVKRSVILWRWAAPRSSMVFVNCYH